MIDSPEPDEDLDEAEELEDPGIPHPDVVVYGNGIRRPWDFA